MLAKFGCEGQVAGEDQPVIEKILLEDDAGLEFAEIWPDRRLEINSKADRIGVGTEDSVNPLQRNPDKTGRIEMVIRAGIEVGELLRGCSRPIYRIVEGTGRGSRIAEMRQ